jgi:hypothetical protein
MTRGCPLARDGAFLAREGVLLAREVALVVPFAIGSPSILKRRL